MRAQAEEARGKRYTETVYFVSKDYILDEEEIGQDDEDEEEIFYGEESEDEMDNLEETF
jgi:hypothetical protein